ncbi:MAG: MATE family efflux transporter [Terriglobia bacterium]|nr:MAG: MATE family efflux transporter [Terriglobia bacterium]
MATENFRKELRPMWALAWPLALAELGWMAQGLIDLIMAGRLGAAAIGGGTLGNMLFYPIASCGVGVLLGMDTLVAQSFGAADPHDCRKTLVNGVWLALGIAPVLALALWALIPLIRVLGTNPSVLAQFEPYLNALLWSMLPLLLYTAFRRYLQAVNLVKPVTFTLVTANLVNIAGNWILMYGHLGAPALGLRGSGWSTTIARAYMAMVLFGTAIWHERASGWLLWSISWRPDMVRLRRLISLGAPAAAQMAIEGAVFGLVTVLAARLDEVSLAAHSIAVNVVSTTFMVPLGISAAAAVRVGHAVGRKDLRGAALAGWAAVLLGALFMGSCGLALWLIPRWIVRIYSSETAVILRGATLLRIAALFQLFDGFQVVTTGALRGLGDTRSPMVAHLVGYWVIGLPISYVLCFPYGWGASGIWAGLSTALILIGAVLLMVWRTRVARDIY